MSTSIIDRLSCQRMLGGEYEDGEETKSDFLARMLLMDRIEIDPTGK